MVRLHPKDYERLGWGRKVVGLRVHLERARPDDVRGLLRTAWQRKLGKR
jgi:hypothetical protein